MSAASGVMLQHRVLRCSGRCDVNILFVLIPLGLVLVAFGLWAFFWAVGSGQFDDLDSPGWSVLADSEDRPPDATGPSQDEPEKDAP
jgi:cbb3-type cytochrome oxidase maturation protein